MSTNKEQKGNFSLKEGGKADIPNILMHIFRVCMAPSPAVGVRAGGSSASTIPRVGIRASCITHVSNMDCHTHIHTIMEQLHSANNHIIYYTVIKQ